MRRIFGRWIFGLAVLLGLALFGLSSNTPAQAAGTVTNCTTYGPGTGTLQQALVGGGGVQFACSGTIPIPATINIANITSLDATGQNVTLDGQHSVQLFSVGPGISFTVKSLTLSNGNAGANGGGAINISNSYLQVENSRFTGNSAATGGAIYIGGSPAPNFTSATILSTTIANNTATTDGAGVAIVTSDPNSGATALIKASTIATNTATNVGGGLLVRGGPNNTAPSVTVANSTISSNSAQQGGGIGAETYSANNLQLINVTLGGNNASTAGNSLFNSSTITNSFLVTNTILSGPFTGTNCSGLLSDGGHNIQWPDSSCLGWKDDPKLGPLQDNGGPTFTQVPGVNHGGDTTTCLNPPVNGYDQRGVSRNFAFGCSVGAYQINNLIVNSVADTDDGSCDALGTGPGNQDCTLREAINIANAHNDQDSIWFNIPGSSTHTITLTSPLPPIKYPTYIRGEIPGVAQSYCNIYDYNGSSVPFTPTVEINGAQAGPNSKGLVFQSSRSGLFGLSITGFNTQVSLESPTFTTTDTSLPSVWLACNYLGVHPDGKTTGTGQSVGLKILNSSSNFVGGAASRTTHNVISGNAQAGLLIQGSNSYSNTIVSNYIGIDATGTQAVPNGTGILIDNAPYNMIGDYPGGLGWVSNENIVAGNNNDGILIQGSAAVSNTLTATNIGITASPNSTVANGLPTVALGNGGNGLHIVNAPNTSLIYNTIGLSGASGVKIEGSSATNNVVGGNAGGFGQNTIISNTLHGVLIENAPTNSVLANGIAGNGGSAVVISGTNATGNILGGNYIGVTTTLYSPLITSSVGYGVLVEGGASSNQSIGNTITGNGKAGVYLADGTGNAVQRNSIYSSGGLGIDLAPTGVNPNGSSSPANLGQPYPVFSSVISANGVVSATGVLSATANRPYTLDFYSNQTCDPSGYGEGQTYLASLVVTTTAGGQASFSFNHSIAAGNYYLTATATDANGNTSEFSACQTAQPLTAPVITAQTPSQPVQVGQAISLSVTATGTLPLSYQWYTGASGQTANPIAGATSSTYTTPPLFSTSTYWVRVSNAAGQADSATITLTVQAPPTCTNDLQVSQTSDNGQGACGTLSHALSYANALSSTTPINISFTVLTVTVSGPLPAISNTNGTRIVVDGGCSTVSGRGQPGVYLIAATGAGSSGLQLGNNVTVSGLAIGGFSGYALDVQGSNNVLKCNWLGNVNGVAGSTNGGGIRLGTTSVPARGVRSGAIRATGNASNNSLGVAGDPTSGNVIGGNGGYGVLVGNGQANTAYYNWIGYNRDGTPNHNANGAVQVTRGGQLKFGVGNRIRN